MEIQARSDASHRRSHRVSVAFPVEVSGIDLAGKPFCERTSTIAISRYGCCVPIPTPLRPDHPIHLRRVGTDEQVVGRVVSSMGPHERGFLHGIGTKESCESFWNGVRFPSSIYEQILDTMHDGVYFVDRERKITYWNAGAERLSGFSANQAVGKRCTNNFLGHVDDSGNPLCTTGCPLTKVLSDGLTRETEIYLRHSNGYRVPINVRVQPLRNPDGEIVGAVEVFSDSTEKKQTEQRVGELEKLAFRDPLTNLQNRRYLELKVAQALQEHHEFSREYGLLLLDLDHFKQVNDMHGHDSGDALLGVVAETLLRSLRAVDLVGRWGGEEFLVLMPDANATVLGDLAERCRVLIAHSSVKRGASQVSVTASIGVTRLNHEDSAATAIRRADDLMYESKRSGGDRTTAG